MAVVFAMLCGVGAGLALARRGRFPRLQTCLGAAQGAGAAILLFCIGLWMGGDPQLLQALRRAGAAGAAIALAGAAASVAAAWLLARLLRRRGSPP